MKNKIMKTISVLALISTMVSAFMVPQSVFANATPVRSCVSWSQTTGLHTYYYTSCSDGWYIITHYDGELDCSYQTRIAPNGEEIIISNCG